MVEGGYRLLGAGLASSSDGISCLSESDSSNGLNDDLKLWACFNYLRN